MLKISKAEAANQFVTLKLEGRVVGPWVGELNQSCDLVLNGGQALKLDLTDVSFADAGGIAALFRLKSRGVTLTNCSPFVGEQLKSSPYS
jgi:ABC-type transporter Mla MlaB component